MNLKLDAILVGRTLGGVVIVLAVVSAIVAAANARDNTALGLRRNGADHREEDRRGRQR